MARGGGGGDPDRGGNLKKMKKKRLGVGKSASRLPWKKRGKKNKRIGKYGECRRVQIKYTEKS